MAVVSVAIHIFRINYPSAVANHFICSLLDKDFCVVQKKKKIFKIQHDVPNTEYGIYTLPGRVVG